MKSSTNTLISALKVIAEDMNNYRVFSESNCSLYHCTMMEAADRLGEMQEAIKWYRGITEKECGND
jgi:hypothetical protein